MADEANVRKRYVKPELTRVDLIEDEVALATCKIATPQTTGKFKGGLASCSFNNCKTNGRS